MLHRELLSKELVHRREDFSEFASLQAVDIDLILSLLESLAHDADILESVRSSEGQGAIPSDEIHINNGFTIPFSTKWSNHEESREWAAKVLDKRTTFAADGSQLYVERETSLPVGAVQIGWFENPHDASKKYEKNVSFELLTPKALLEDQEEPLNPETRVGERRFHAEVERVGEFLDKHRGWREKNERMPVAFFDGTLLVSFSLPQTSLQQSFLSAMLGLVGKSRETGVPLVGYVDRSFAKDIVTMVSALEPSLKETTIYDTSLLSISTERNKPLLKNWGDRSIFCESKRKGLEMFVDEGSGKALVGFCYLKSTADAASARLDIPYWIYSAGLLDELIDVVRAECVVGLGYPYALETADATALISNRDREVFIGALREFSAREGLKFSVSRKNASKARRR